MHAIPAILFIMLFLGTQIAAHGPVVKVSVNQVPVRVDIIRQISDPLTIMGAKNRFLSCGPDAQPAATAVQAQPGDMLSFFRRDVRLNVRILRWPHNVGPMMTCLAKCKDEDCTTFDSAKAEWFKIKQDGRVGGNDGDWVQSIIYPHRQTLVNADNVPANVTLPSQLAHGPYLIRHEIIALHNANPRNGRGAEFYPSCSQILVGGNETGGPTEDELVNFPGGYNDDDPGIKVDVYTTPNPKYIFPGPPIAAFVSSASSAKSHNIGAATRTRSGRGRGFGREDKRPPRQ
ncbi:glycoside hydrolase family 61 protein [Mycena rebaudengoi]|nr:glycoside hydrolase family 61 protein [Mycena rebaudengoi]